MYHAHTETVTNNATNGFLGTIIQRVKYKYKDQNKCSYCKCRFEMFNVLSVLFGSTFRKLKVASNDDGCFLFTRMSSCADLGSTQQSDHCGNSMVVVEERDEKLRHFVR